ncbi:hypothetical protein [Massilia sp. Leaf139]|uniref:hypothetical protein n=1 Tax=Massilia sp. Leaf139 TaxID=1736272 RepID=UPI000A8C0B6F|nr:hypothetical protein [Massilia sp. Leaf139]
MSTFIQEIHGLANSIPSYFQVVLVSIVCLFTMNQALDFGKQLGALCYRMLH